MMKIKNAVAILLIGFFASALIACKNSDNSIGFTGDDLLTVEITDSINVLSSTYLLDSLPSSNTGVIMVGKTNDPALGKLSVSSYFRIKPDADLVIPQNAVFDSLRLVLKYNKYSYGDTSRIQELSVHRLLEHIKLHRSNSHIEPEEQPLFAKDEDALFNTSSFRYEKNPLGKHVFKPSPNGTDSVSIRLQDQWGLELFKLLIAKDKRVTDAAEFVNYFHGFHLQANADASVIGFNAPDVKMYVHYQYPDDNGFRKKGRSMFSLHDKQYQFNQMKADRQSTHFKDLTGSHQELAAGKSNQQLFLQGGTGVVTKILLPGLTQLMKEPGIIVNKAELIIQTKPSTYKLYKAPPALILFIANGRNTPKFILSEPYKDPIQQAMFNPANDGKGLASYTFLLTEYVDKLKKGEHKDTSFLLSLPVDDLIRTVNSLHIMNGEAVASISTRIIYTKY